MFCAGCGAPLTLGSEAQAPLDATLDLDRRAPRPAPPAGGAPTVIRPPLQPPARAAPAATQVRPPAAPPAAPAPARPAPAAAARPPNAAASPPAPRPPPIAGSVLRPAEPLVPPVSDRSHWDMRLSEMPRERSPDFESSTSPLPPPTSRVEPLPGLASKAAPRPAPHDGGREGAANLDAPGALDAADTFGGLDASPSEVVDVDLGPAEIHLRRAPDWRRVTAWILDGAPFLALFALVLRFALDHLPHGPLDALGYLDLAASEAKDVTGPILACVLVLHAVYHALSHGLTGATLGKKLLGLRVVGRDGRRPGLGRATVRALVAGLSVALAGLGVLLALFTRSGRALHDFLARTWVVRAP